MWSRRATTAAADDDSDIDDGVEAIEARRWNRRRRRAEYHVKWKGSGGAASTASGSIAASTATLSVVEVGEWEALLVPDGW